MAVERWQGETLKRKTKKKAIASRINVSDNYVFTGITKRFGGDTEPREGEVNSRALRRGSHIFTR